MRISRRSPPVLFSVSILENIDPGYEIQLLRMRIDGRLTLINDYECEGSSATPGATAGESPY